MNEIINETNKTVSGDKKISVAIMSSFIILTIQYFILTYFNLLGTSNADKIQLLSKIFVGVLYIIAFPVVLKRNKEKFIGVYFVTIFMFLINYMFFNENWIYLKDIIFPYFFTCLPSLIYSYSINDWTILKDVMKKASLLVFIFGAIIGVLVFANKISIGAYSMPLSYYMLLPTIVYMDEFLKKFNFRSIFISLISLFIILTLGSRGPIMCAGIFVILNLISVNKKLNYKIILLYLIVLFVMIITILFFNTILEDLNNYLLKLGIHSRSIHLFLQDDIYLSGRENLYKDIISEIKSNPILGIGLAGDRRVIGKGYVHNILIEIVSNFGIVIGSILILFLLIVSYKTLFSKHKEQSSFVVIWFCIGVVHLMVSSSYLIDFRFWIYLGLIMRYMNDLKS